MFKPMLAPNEEINLDTLSYPLLASDKLDGIRALPINGELLSRSLKQIPNKQIQERLIAIRRYSKEHNVIFDGELYSPNMTFQQITHFVMTQDLEDETLPLDLRFHCFDMINPARLDERFAVRQHNLQKFYTPDIGETCVRVEQTLVRSADEVRQLFIEALDRGQEGLILRDPEGRYKCGRGTIKEGLIYKCKPFITFDAQITGVVQSTEVREGAEKKTNELGRSVTSKKKDDRVLIEKASAFEVLYEGKPLKVTLAMPDKEKEHVWAFRELYIGKHIEYKGMLIGSKEVPRHPVMLRFRTDKD